MRRRLGHLWVCGLLLAGLSAPAAEAEELVGALHEHSGYSDGWPGSRPADYYASGKSFGLDFVGGSDHSDAFAYPGVFSEDCLVPTPPVECALADPVNPEDSFRKWAATQEQAVAASDADFTGFRGFEWTSDRFGHINVYFSSNYTNAKADGGYVSMESFWSWLTNRPQIGGGGDGLGVFNHPDAKKLSDEDPGVNWNDFTYVPAADGRMVGIEVFNDGSAYDSWYARALDAGWHVGAVGAEDLGHDRSDDWGGPSRPKTVIEASDRSSASLKEAMKARRFYAVRRPSLRMSFTVDGAPMGSRLGPAEGAPLSIAASVTGATAPTLELVTSGGAVVGSSTGDLALSRPASLDEDWYFVRVEEAGEPVAYSSPVWIEARPLAQAGTQRWLAGDLHVHTCYSHDSYCPPDDDNTGPEDFYTAGLTVGERFAEGQARGLDFLAITDHNDVRSVTDPGFASRGLIGIPAYENSLNGHAQMLGARELYDAGDKSAGAVNAMADRLRADGGVFQINHPVPDEPGPYDGCGPELDWGYSLEVRPDVVEVWNSANASLPETVAYWERCWLDRGERIGATAGSDSHWAAIAATQGAGNPTTWVLADEASEGGVLEAIETGRTTISRLSPSQGGARLLLEADGDGDGVYEATIGDTVPPGVAMRVRVEDGDAGGGLVRVRANGETIVEDQPLGPDGVVAVPPVGQPGWVRAELRFTSAQIQETFRCGLIPLVGELPCPVDQAMAAMTSPIWLEAAPDPDDPDPPDPDPDPDEPPPVDPPADGPGSGVRPGQEAAGGGGGSLGGRAPRILPRRGIRDAKRHGAFKVARLECGSQPCTVVAPHRVTLRGLEVPLRARVRAPRLLAAGEAAPVKLRLRDEVMLELGVQIGRAKLRLQVESASGSASRKIPARVRGPRAR